MKTPGRPRKSRLADMAVYPDTPECFTPPSLEECDEISYPLDLGAGLGAGVRQVFRRDTSVLVYFAIWQSVQVNGRWSSVARIDTSHSNVHHHQFTATGDEKIEILERYTELHAEEVIDRWISRAEDIFGADWELHMRRWNGDAE